MRIAPVLLGIVLVGLHTASATPAAMVEFGDGDFTPGSFVCVPGSAAGSGSELADYELVKDVRGGPDGFTCYEHRASGFGNPGAYVQAIIEPEGGQIIACMFKNDAVYDPGTLGALAYIDYTEDSICFAPGATQCMSTGACLRQAGNLYFARAGFVPETTWTPKAFYGVGPTDFVWLSGPGPTVPDFSASGAPLAFGFHRAKSGGPGIETGLDDWRIVTHDPCTGNGDCDDTNACTAESCVSGICERAPLDCDDANGCTQNVCTAGVCSHPPLVCDDGDDCTSDICSAGFCFSSPLADLATVSVKIDELLAILEGPACGDELLKRSFLRKFVRKLKKSRAKVDKADGIPDVLRIPGLIAKADVLLDKARTFLAAQASNGKISPECATGLTTYVDGIDTCLAAVPAPQS